MKVHFAGCDGSAADKVLHEHGIRYRLSSYFYIRKKKDFECQHLNMFQHSIVDSGLFSLMYGAGSATTTTDKQFYSYQKEYIKWINSHAWQNVSFVECDVQKKLSPEIAWEMRREFRASVTVPIMNVYHLEDENPDRLIDFADYIAISLPELRFNVTDKERLQITKYIAVKACLKNKRVHLLGCTEEEYIRYFSFCFSCDSTSWISPLRYGDLDSDLFGTVHMNEIKKLTENDMPRMQAICAYVHQLKYASQSGNQL